MTLALEHTISSSCVNSTVVLHFTALSPVEFGPFLFYSAKSVLSDKLEVSKPAGGDGFNTMSEDESTLECSMQLGQILRAIQLWERVMEERNATKLRWL